MTAEDKSVHTVHDAPSHGPDTGAAFAGLIVGAIVLFALLLFNRAHHERALRAHRSQPESGQVAAVAPSRGCGPTFYPLRSPLFEY